MKRNRKAAKQLRAAGQFQSNEGPDKTEGWEIDECVACTAPMDEEVRKPILSRLSDISKPELVSPPKIEEEVYQEVKRCINLLTSTPTTQLNAVDSASTLMKWIKVPIAMDSGSMANVTPPSLFSVLVQATDASRNKEVFHGADSTAIPNLGSQSVSGKSDSDNPVNIDIDFEVANISRPLGSVSKLLRKNNKVVLDEGNSFIQNKTTGQKVSLREEGGLFFLDVWVEVPHDMVINPGFARQVGA